MSHPGRVGGHYSCHDCGADLEEVRIGGRFAFRCPWSTGRTRDCGQPYGRPRYDQGGEYARDQMRTRSAR